jgi:lipopolysaccharide/colanic/teichoic acid biosynthesis glycosyltransferase
MPAGIYLFERSALERIPRSVYYDLKEQFIPDLLLSGAEVRSHAITGYVRGIHQADDYLAAHRDLLRGRTGRTPAGEEVAEGIWIEDGAVVDPAAILIGPICVGRGARIEAGARIVGPSAIGRDAVIRSGALIRDSVIVDGAIVGAGARLDRCIVAQGAVVAEGTVQESAVVADAIESLGDQTLIERDLRIGVAAVPVDRYLAARGRERTYQAAKRVFDLLFALFGLVLAAPVMALVALAIRVESTGPIFFRQQRCGRNGRPFGMIKFRSMRKDAEAIKTVLRASNECDGPVFKISDDPRFTRVGRWLRRYSLDELPQLWNILRGEMSVVGPRPLALEELRMCPSWRDARLRVKPGLTGLWQVSSRDKNHFQEWIKHDLKYVKEQSLLLDMKIVWRTVAALAKGL